MKHQFRKKTLLGINSKDGWINKVDLAKKKLNHHFSNMFCESFSLRPNLDGVNFDQLTREDNSMLEELFSEEEIKDVEWSCDGDKSLGPDGFNLDFFKDCWFIAKEDVCGFVNKFYSVDVLPKAVTTLFLTLIPNR